MVLAQHPGCGGFFLEPEAVFHGRQETVSLIANSKGVSIETVETPLDLPLTPTLLVVN